MGTAADKLVCYQVYYQCSQVDDLPYGQYQPTQIHFSKSTSMSVTVNAYIQYLSISLLIVICISILIYHVTAVFYSASRHIPPLPTQHKRRQLSTYSLHSRCLFMVNPALRRTRVHKTPTQNYTHKLHQQEYGTQHVRKQYGISIRIEWNTIYNVTVHPAAAAPFRYISEQNHIEVSYIVVRLAINLAVLCILEPICRC